MYLPEIKIKTVKRLLILHTLPEWQFIIQAFPYPYKARLLDINFRYDDQGVVLAGPIFSSPKVALLLEFLRERGLSETLAIGWAGKNPEGNLKLGDLFIPNKAISLEGTTKFYFENIDTFEVNNHIFTKTKELLQRYEIPFKVGTILTADAPWKMEEIKRKIEAFKKHKMEIDALDMETSAYYGILEFYGIPGIALHFITDEIGRFTTKRPESIMRTQRRRLCLFVEHFLKKGFENTA